MHGLFEVAEVQSTCAELSTKRHAGFVGAGSPTRPRESVRLVAELDDESFAAEGPPVSSR